jgi:hypothetical protein
MYISKLIAMSAYCRFWPVSSDHHPYFASYSSGWIGTQLLALMHSTVSSDVFFKLARCGYALRVTSQIYYSPEYTTPTQKNSYY